VSAWLQPEPANWWHVVDEAIQEDVGSGDVTGGCVDPDTMVDWYVEIQQDGVICGLGIVEYLMAPYQSDPDDSSLTYNSADGDPVKREQRVVEGRIPARRALMAERTLLNFLMHLSGVATLTSQFVAKVGDAQAKVVDTRKTLPGMRALQKYAVRCGGGHNHRMGLFDGVLIKDNHIRVCGSIARAVERVRSYASPLIKVEVECQSLEQVDEAVDSGADIVMLDNMDPFMMRDAVKRYEGQVLFEASGGINLDTVRGVAQTGVDLISIGALTHSAPSLMLHMEMA
jgi:nicotinate-nucleotide pyrophosphorylase (carboxylating)